MKNIGKCKICQKTLKKGAKYCSKKCYWSVSAKYKTKCRLCGKEFYTYPCWVKKGEGFLCSKKCQYEWMSKGYKGVDTKKNPQHASQAWSKLNHEIERKEMIRQPCQICGNPKSHAHHEDYLKPLKVVWLCAKHHQLLHTGKLKIKL